MFFMSSGCRQNHETFSLRRMWFVIGFTLHKTGVKFRLFFIKDPLLLRTLLLDPLSFGTLDHGPFTRFIYYIYTSVSHFGQWEELLFKSVVTRQLTDVVFVSPSQNKFTSVSYFIFVDSCTLTDRNNLLLDMYFVRIPSTFERDL